MPATSIFLSNARDDDEPFVKRLYGDLTDPRLDVWWDRVSTSSRILTFLRTSGVVSVVPPSPRCSGPLALQPRQRRCGLPLTVPSHRMPLDTLLERPDG